MRRLDREVKDVLEIRRVSIRTVNKNLKTLCH